MTILLYLIIGLIAGWLGYRAGIQHADWWRSHAEMMSRFYWEQREHTHQAIEIADQAMANTSRARKALTQLLPRGVREEVQRLNEKVETTQKAEATETDEFPSELDLS